MRILPIALLMSLAVSPAVAQKPHKVLLRWQGAPKGIVYNVYRSDDGGKHFKLVARSLPTPSYADRHVRAGKRYVYHVTNVMAHQESQPATIAADVPR